MNVTCWFPKETPTWKFRSILPVSDSCRSSGFLLRRLFVSLGTLVLLYFHLCLKEWACRSTGLFDFLLFIPSHGSKTPRDPFFFFPLFEDPPLLCFLLRGGSFQFFLQHTLCRGRCLQRAHRLLSSWFSLEASAGRGTVVGDVPFQRENRPPPFNSQQTTVLLFFGGVELPLKFFFAHFAGCLRRFTFT